MLLSDTALNHSAGKKSFEDLRTVENVAYDTFRDTCRALGMLQDDQLWHMTMDDAKQLKLPMQMRELFVILMTFSELNDPKALFEAFSEAMSEDFEYQIRDVANIEAQLPNWMLLMDIQERLESAGNGPLFQRIGEVTDEMKQAVANARRQHALQIECREIREELDYDREEMERLLDNALKGQ